MKTYRIKEHFTGFFKSYEIQRKSILGFWYNPENIDGYSTGFYESEEELKEHIKKLQTPYKTRIIELNN